MPQASFHTGKYVTKGIGVSIYLSGRDSLIMVVKIMSDSKRMKEKVQFHVSKLAGAVQIISL